MLKHIGYIAGVALLGCALLTAQSVRDVNGRVFEVTSRRGIENLEVKLTPPRSSDLAIRLASTNQNGEFHFTQVKPSKYLLEVSQGPNLLYRNEIDASTADSIEIPLQKH